MTPEAAPDRVLVFTPRGRDAELTCELLRASSISVHPCASGAELAAAIRDGASCAIVTTEALDAVLHRTLRELLADQPPWSDFPILVLTRGGRPPRADMFELGNVTILERPVAPPTLLASVRASLRARGRQYDARDAIHQRDQFLAMLGHELRNPLAAITLACEPHPTGDAAMVDKRFAVIARQSGHLIRIVDDLLDVARVTTGKIQLHREAVDIDDMIRQAIEAVEPRARARGITFDVSLASGIILEGDAGRLGQVVGNLVTNAIKYSPVGRRVAVSSERVGSWCEIWVRDQGIGIAPDMLPRVFELFVQADASLDRADGGMGIGLALVERLVRLHGGTVSVTSGGLGQGSEFVVRLPIGSPPEADAGSPPASSELHRPLRVVIVEDNHDLIELTKMVLESFGCTTECAFDGEDGLDRILATEPDLALVDIGLPKLDGYELARRVKQALPAPPTLIAISGYGQRNDRERALAAGFDDHFTKPVRSQALQQLVEATRNRLVARAGGAPTSPLS